MRARHPLCAALALAIAAPAAPGMAQAAKTGPTPTQAQMQHAAENFRVLVSALQSDKVPQAVKGILFTCMYANPFSKVSESTDKVVAEKKLDKKNPSQVLSAMAAVCGFRPEMANQPKK